MTSEEDVQDMSLSWLGNAGMMCVCARPRGCSTFSGQKRQISEHIIVQIIQVDVRVTWQSQWL